MALVIVAFVVFFGLVVAAAVARGSEMRHARNPGPPPGIPEWDGGPGSGAV